MSRFYALALAALAFTACAAPQPLIPAPKGFARFAGAAPLRAISSDGVLYRVRTEKNEPKAELKFWSEALKKRMLDAGYLFVKDGEIKAAGDVPGYLLELAAPVGHQDYGYLVAIFVSGERITIAEATGNVTDLTEHREPVLEAMAAVETR